MGMACTEHLKRCSPTMQSNGAVTPGSYYYFYHYYDYHYYHYRNDDEYCH